MSSLRVRLTPEFRREVSTVVRVAAPAVAQSLLQTMVFLVDRLMLGRHGEAALASMQVAGPLIWTLQSVFGAFAAGTIAVVGRCVGAGDRDGATSALRGSLLLAGAFGLVVATAALATLDPMLSLMTHDARPDVLFEARGYLSVLLLALPLLYGATVATSALQAAGDTRTPFAIAIVTNVVNVIGNWFLIFGHGGLPRMGARGAAISNSAALALEAALGVWALSSSRSPVALRARRGAVIDSVAGARRVLAVTWSAFFERGVYHVGYLAFVRIINGLGATAMAAHQALLSLESVSFLTADGFAVAASARVSQSLGAGDPQSARRAGFAAALLASLLASVFALVFALSPSFLITAFRDDPATCAMAVPAMRAAAIAQVPMALSIVLAQSLRGAGSTREALAVAFVGSLGVRIAATTALVPVMGLGLVGVWLGSACDWIVRAALCVWRWRVGRWAKTRV